MTTTWMSGRRPNLLTCCTIVCAGVDAGICNRDAHETHRKSHSGGSNGKDHGRVLHRIAAHLKRTRNIIRMGMKGIGKSTGRGKFLGRNRETEVRRARYGKTIGGE